MKIMYRISFHVVLELNYENKVGTTACKMQLQQALVPGNNRFSSTTQVLRQTSKGYLQLLDIMFIHEGINLNKCWW